MPEGQKKITSPEEFFGFRMGSDRKIARWDKIVEYFQQLETESDRVKVVDMGKSTEGNPFLLVIISSAANLKNLEKLREINGKLADPRGLAEEEARRLVGRGRAVVCQSMSLHATEIGGTQMSPELAYELVTVDTPDNRAILDNVVFLMIPCFNPDGQIMVTDWYNRWLDTEYEGCNQPWLYHKYSGHDNNRDAFAQNLPESRYMAQVLLRDWHPHAYQDHHHMGSYGARLFLVPYCEPIHPYADPLTWREESWYGAHMAYKLEENEKYGIFNAGQYPGWAHMGFHWLAAYHNTPSMLTESASAKLATPLFIHPSQLEGASKKTMPKYEAQTNFPHPWEGGWWRLRDIVEQQKIAAWALLDLAAKHRETVLWNGYLKAKRQAERGAAEGEPKAYLIAPELENDPLTAHKLARIMLGQGVEVKVATREFVADGRIYPRGTYAIFLDQPKMGVVRTLLERTFFPDNYWTRNPDGSPIIYDTATDTVAEFMGVRVRRVDEPFEGRFTVVKGEEAARAAGGITAAAGPAGANGATGTNRAKGAGGAGYVLDGRLNDSYRAVNRLLAAGAKVWRLEQVVKVGAETLPAGAFFVASGAGAAQLVGGLAGELGLTFHGMAAAPQAAGRQLQPLRIAMYQRYYGGNMDEGWTRYVFDQFEVPYVTVRDADIKAGGAALKERFDVLIFPSDRKQFIIDVTKPDRGEPLNEFVRRMIDNVPPEFRSGIGDDGVKAVREFVKAGGRLVAFDAACDFAIDACELKVKNVLAGTTWKEFHCPGSTLRAKVDTSHPLAWGMPKDAWVMNFRSPAFSIQERVHAENYEIVVEYPKKDLLQSGWLVGEDRVAGQAAMVAAKCGEGQVVLIGFRPQFRAQTHGTFKLLFNCLV